MSVIDALFLHRDHTPTVRIFTVNPETIRYTAQRVPRMLIENHHARFTV